MNTHVFVDREFLCSYLTDRLLVEPSPDRNSTLSDAQEDDLSTTDPKPSTSSTSHIDELCTLDVNMSATSILVSPEQMRPFPKTDARKNSKRDGRKPGTCRILIDTSEKTEIEQHAEIRKQKNQIKSIPKK